MKHNTKIKTLELEHIQEDLFFPSFLIFKNFQRTEKQNEQRTSAHILPIPSVHNAQGHIRALTYVHSFLSHLRVTNIMTLHSATLKYHRHS